MEPGVLARAVYAFSSTAEDELILEVGSVVQVIRQIDRYWTYGCCLGRYGNFPTEFVTKVPLPPFEPGQKLFVAMVSFIAEVSDDLTLTKGDVVVGVEPIDANWWRGKVDNRIGIFPLNLVWEVDTSLIKVKNTEKKAVKLKARVNMDLKAQLDEEVDLCMGDIVTIFEIIDEDWYRGESNGKNGIFPSSFVTVMKEKEELSVSQMPDLLSFVNGNSERSASDLSVFDPLLNYEISIDSKAPPSTATTKTHLIESLSKSIEADLILIQNNQENSGLQSHCKTLYSFRDRASDSLEFDAGEVVRLLRRVGDGQWLEGELRGKVGMFPASYVQIIVDLPKQESTCQTLPEQLSAVTKSNDVNGSKSGMNEAICLYNFQSQERGDVSLYEGERAVILQRVDINWYIVRNSSGECGLCPANYLKLLDSAIIDRNGVFESQTVSRNCMTKSQRELDISSETFTDSVNLSQPTVVPALNKSTSLSQSQADNLSGHSTDSDSQRTLSKSLYTIDSSIQSSVNSFNGVANVWCLDRRSSCPTSSHVKTATPPSRPPPPVITDRKSVSSPARRHPRDRPRVPLRSAPPVPATSQRPASVATSVNLWKTYRHHQLNKGWYTTRTMSETDRKSTEFSSIDYGVIEDDDIELDPSQLRRRPTTRSRTDSDVSVTDAKGRSGIMVLDELVATERTYVEDLRFCMNAFLPKAEEAKLKGINIEVLLGHLEPVLAVNTKLLNSLEDILATNSPQEQLSALGKCFRDSAPAIKKTYADYCANHNDVINLLEKYEENSEIATYIRKVLGNEQDPKYFDLSSILIKPVQRVLKYPLLLRGLVKVAEKEEDHQGAVELKAALDAMTDVASEVNESKRKKDLVLKYRKESDGGLSAKISKLTIHSMKKKSQRIGMRLSSSLGLVHVTKDLAFDDEEQKFRDIERAVKQLLKDAEDFCSYLEACVNVKFQLGEHIADFYGELRTRKNIDNFRTVQRTIKTQIWPEFKKAVDNKFFTPVNTLLHLYEGPNKLIEKRTDKLLDYDAASQKLEKNKDISKGKQCREDLEASKKDYTALNSQLLEELPKLINASITILIHCVGAFLAARKRFIGQTTRLLFTLIEEVPNLPPMDADILSIFNKKHDQIVTWMKTNGVVAKEINSSPLIERSVKDKDHGVRSKKSVVGLNMEIQGSSQRAYLQGRYPDRLFIAVESFVPTGELEVALNMGDVVAVLKQSDPMGNPLHWFVDNGLTKGFVPCNILAPMRMNCPAVLIHPPSSGMEEELSNTMAPQPHRYDTVSEEELLQYRYENIDNKDQDRYYETTDRIHYDLPCDSPSTTDLKQCHQNAGGEMFSNSHLDMIDPASFQVGQSTQDTGQASLTSSVSTTQIDVHNLEREVSNAQEYYYAGFSFEATSQHEMGLAEGQVILVHHKRDLEGNPEWWFVEDRYGNLGYVPATYLLPYQRQ